LNGIHEWPKEGFDTADLREAKILLNDWECSDVSSSKISWGVKAE
jgi:hypothetical protein